MNFFQVCSNELESLDSMSLRFRPKTNDPIKNGRLIAESFERSSEDERKALIESVSPALSMKLIGLSGFMAEAAINSGDESFIRLSILLHVVEDFRKDYRENYRYLALIYYASKRLGVDFQSTIEYVISLASGRAAKYLQDFSNRDETLNALQSFGVRAEVSEGTFRFVAM